MIQHIESVAHQIQVKTGRVFITAGGITCAVISQDTAFLERLREFYGSGEPASRADYEIILVLAPHDEFKQESAKEFHGPSIRKVKTGNNYIIRSYHHPFQAIVNTLSGKVLAKIPRSLPSLDCFMRTLFKLALADEKSLLLNASAVSAKNRAIVFFGPPGCGKTTAARLSGLPLVTDSLAVIKPYSGGYRVYNTPFSDDAVIESAENSRAELEALYLLRKDKKNRLVKLDNVRAVSELYRNVLFFTDDSKLLNRVFRACYSLAKTVPVYRLHFREDASIRDILKEKD